MFYTFQMNNGRWQVDAFTSASPSAKRLAFAAPSFDTREEAETYRHAMVKAWSETRATVPAYKTEFTPWGEQGIIPGCEKNQSPRMRQLDLFG
jgi:hypothetical protein